MANKDYPIKEVNEILENLIGAFIHYYQDSNHKSLANIEKNQNLKAVFFRKLDSDGKKSTIEPGFKISRSTLEPFFNSDKKRTYNDKTNVKIEALIKFYESHIYVPDEKTYRKVEKNKLLNIGYDNLIKGTEIINQDFYKKLITGNSFSKSHFYLSKLNDEYQWQGVYSEYDIIRKEVGEITTICLSTFKDKSKLKVIGIVNGSGGAGKSTILRRIALELRNENFIVLWIKEHQFYDFINEGWSTVKSDAAKNYLIIIEDWYRLTNNLEKEAHKLLNETKCISNVRILIGDRRNDGGYSSHLNNANAFFTLKNSENWDIISAIIFKNPEWNINLEDIILYKESINNTPLFLMIYTLTRQYQAEIIVSNSGFEDPELAFQEIIASDIKKLLKVYPGLGKALFYWANIYKKNKFHIAYGTFLEIVNYFNEGNTIGFLFKNLKNDTSIYHDILRNYITIKESQTIEYIQFNHDTFAEKGISKIEDLLKGQIRYDDIVKRTFLEAIFDFKSHDKSMALLLFHFLKYEKRLFKDDLERLSYVERLIDNGNKEMSFLNRMNELILDESTQLEFVKKLLSQSIYPQSYIEKHIKKHQVIRTYILNHIDDFKDFPSNLYFSAIRNAQSNDIQNAVNSILESEHILSYNERVLADAIKTCIDSDIKQNGIQKILAQHENYFSLDKILLQRIIKYSSNYEDTKNAIRGILNALNIISLPFEIVAEAFRKSQDDNDKLKASETILNSHIATDETLYKMVSKAMLECPDKGIKLAMAKRVIINSDEFHPSLRFHSLGCFVDEKPIPQFVVDLVEQIIKNRMSKDDPKTCWYYYKRVTRIPLHSIPSWKKATRRILNNWHGQRDRGYIHNVLLSYKGFPEETREACKEILENWRKEIEIPIKQVRREEPYHYGDHVKLALEHPYLDSLAKQAALEIRAAHNSKTCKKVKLHMQKAISKILDSQ